MVPSFFIPKLFLSDTINCMSRAGLEPAPTASRLSSRGDVKDKYYPMLSVKTTSIAQVVDFLI
jgi:hypothetical protein